MMFLPVPTKFPASANELAKLEWRSSQKVRALSSRSAAAAIAPPAVTQNRVPSG
jgi:hypothetical protein